MTTPRYLKGGLIATSHRPDRPLFFLTTSYTQNTKHNVFTKGCHRHLHHVRPHRQTYVASVLLQMLAADPHKTLVAEAEKAGIEKAGGSATIFQYVYAASIPTTK